MPFDRLTKRGCEGDHNQGDLGEIESLYMTKCVTNRLLLNNRFYDFRLEEGKPLKPHLDEFYSIAMVLQKFNVKLDDKDSAICLLCSLTPSYTNFGETLLYGRDNLSSDNVKNALTQRDFIDSQLSHKTHGGSSDGLFVRGMYFERWSIGGSGNKWKIMSKSRGPNKNKTCNYYKLKGNIKKDCWKWKKKNSSNKGAMDGTNNADASYINDNDDGGVLVATHG